MFGEDIYIYMYMYTNLKTKLRKLNIPIVM